MRGFVGGRRVIMEWEYGLGRLSMDGCGGDDERCMIL